MVTAEPEARTEFSPPWACESDPQFVELTVRLPLDWDLTFERICELAVLNELIQFERSADGSMILSFPPPMPEHKWIESSLLQSLLSWCNVSGWVAFGDGFGFQLADGSFLEPDLCCVPRDQLPAKGSADWRRAHTIPPPLVAEIRSRGQTLSTQERKMRQYMSNGVKLGWLIDPIQRRIHIYRPDREPEVLDDPKTLSGEDVMQGLVVDLSDLWP